MRLSSLDLEKIVETSDAHVWSSIFLSTSLVLILTKSALHVQLTIHSSEHPIKKKFHSHWTLSVSYEACEMGRTGISTQPIASQIGVEQIGNRQEVLNYY